MMRNEPSVQVIAALASAVSLAVLAWVAHSQWQRYTITSYAPPWDGLASAVRAAYYTNRQPNGYGTSSIPSAKSFASSADYLKHLVTNGHLTVSGADVFSLPEVPVVPGNDVRRLTWSNNAWCVVFPTEGNPLPDDPFLVSRDVYHLLAAETDGVTSAGSYPRFRTALGTNAFVVITREGSATVRSGPEASMSALGIADRNLRILPP